MNATNRVREIMRRFSRRSLVPLVAALMQFSVVPLWSQAPTRASLQGCYRITRGPLSRKPELGPPKPTTIVRFDTIPAGLGVTGELVAKRIEPAEFVPPGDIRSQWERPARWMLIGADSIHIILWATATEAEVFYGHRVEGGFKGVVRLTSDAIPVDPVTKKILWNWWPWASASLAPVPCP